ncbi:MAG: phosphogluconate dehydrogenase (NAD(+)-dependent, decarboxylating) [Roseiarcus sp.]|jgi:6-phosphogluconate dehydrogenase
MQIGVIGLGRMGGNIVRRLMRAGHSCVVYDRDPAPGLALAKQRARAVESLGALVAGLAAPRAVWIMLPAGAPTEATIDALRPLLSPGDAVIDGGNSFWRDDIRRSAALRADGLHYVDVGTSGGVWGLERGYCLMIGGEHETIARLDPIFKALAPGRGGIEPTPGREGRAANVEEGYLHAGPCGAGHFVKMVHNGVEYGLMQAYAEGFDILRNADSSGVAPEHRFSLDIADIAEVWRRGSVVTSWLLDLTASALAREGALDSYSGFIEDSGEGRWTLMAAINEAVPAEVLSAALYTRFRSRQGHTYAEKIISAMRKGFGGHVEPKAGKG